MKYKCTQSQLASCHYDLQRDTWQEAWTASSMRFSTQCYVQLALNRPRIKAIYLLLVEIGLFARIADKIRHRCMRSNVKHVGTMDRMSGFFSSRQQQTVFKITSESDRGSALSAITLKRIRMLCYHLLEGEGELLHTNANYCSLRLKP